MSRSLDAKLLALGVSGRARLVKAWADADTTTRRIEEAFGLGPPDVRKLLELIGPRPSRPTLRRCEPRGL